MSRYHTVIIEKIIPGGSGLARMPDGLVVMVPRVLPAEKVVVEFLKEKKGFVQANLIEVLEPSPMRIEAPCPYYGQCGGCDLQHVSYPGQLEIKQQIVQEQLDRGLREKKVWEHTSFEILKAAEPFSYRQRVRFQVGKRGDLGFYRFRSQEVVPISECLLAAPMINRVLRELIVSKTVKNILKNSDAVELMHDQQEDKVVASFHYGRKPRATDISNAKNCARTIKDIKSLFLKTKSWGNFGPYPGNVVEDTDQSRAKLLHFAVHLTDGKRADMLFEAGGFCQVNAKQNEKLIQTLLDWGNITNKTTILDLYCGLGNFSIPAAFYGKKITGMDLQRSAIRSARQNAKNNGLENAVFEQKSALDAAREFAESGESFDLVILDPPRHGCKEIVPFIDKIASDQVIYISCDPATLARDLALLCDSGFRVEKIQGVDMFPQTHHIETIVQLRRVSKLCS